MSDLLIKDMNLPKNCFDCTFLRDDFCIVLGYEMRNDQILMGCGSCPLVEVKPHGRLIDADELEASDAITVGKEAWDMVHNAHTVLEASYGCN